MRRVGFSLTYRNIHVKAVPTLQYWVADEDDATFTIPFTMDLRPVELTSLVSCHCAQCIAIAALTVALEDAGSDNPCGCVAGTLEELQKYVEATRGRVGTHERH